MIFEDEPGGMWQIAGASVRGMSHIQFGLPNQDAAKWFVGPEQRSFVLAVADGHGSPAYVRSDRGSKFAVSIAVDELQGFADGSKEGGAGSDLPKLEERILSRWLEAVQTDLAKSPLTGEEAEALAAEELEPNSAYGATLLAAFVSQSYGFAVQIGDGTIYLVGTDGEVAPALTLPDLPGESTYSLCMPDAIEFVEARSFTADDLGRLAAIVISTDGYNKSFRDDTLAAAQIKTMSERLNWDSSETMSRELEEWLGLVSQAGSGDDISLIIAARRGDKA